MSLRCRTDRAGSGTGVVPALAPLLPALPLRALTRRRGRVPAACRVGSIRAACVASSSHTSTRITSAGSTRSLDADVIVPRLEWERATGLGGRVRGYLPQHWPRGLEPTLVDYDGGAIGPFSASFDVLGDGRLLLVPTPGHTAGHAALLVRDGERSWLLAGDMAHTAAELDARRAQRRRLVPSGRSKRSDGARSRRLGGTVVSPVSLCCGSRIDHERMLSMRFGFVGLGRAAQLYHLPAVQALEGGVPVGGFDAAEQQRAAWRAATGLPTFDSLDELLAKGAPDVVVVGTPPASHADVCVQALEAGTHVICEKPFVTSPRRVTASSRPQQPPAGRSR